MQDWTEQAGNGEAVSLLLEFIKFESNGNEALETHW
jgi:hypothetical protein